MLTISSGAYIPKRKTCPVRELLGNARTAPSRRIYQDFPDVRASFLGTFKLRVENAPAGRPGKAPQAGIRNCNNRLASCERPRLDRDFVVFTVASHERKALTVGRPRHVLKTVSFAGIEQLRRVPAVSRHYPNAVLINKSDARSIRRWHCAPSVVSKLDQSPAFGRKTPNGLRVVGSTRSTYQKLGSVPEPCEVRSTEAQAFRYVKRVSLARIHVSQVQTLQIGINNVLSVWRNCSFNYGIIHRIGSNLPRRSLDKRSMIGAIKPAQLQRN